MQAGQDVTIGARLEQAEYQYTLTDTDSDELNHWAPIFLSKLQGMKILTDVASDQQIASPQISVEVDRDAASQLGLSMDAIDADPLRRVRPGAGRDHLLLDAAILRHPGGAAEVPHRARGAVASLRRHSAGAAGAAVGGGPFHQLGRAADGQPPGRVPGGDAVLQPRARASLAKPSTRSTRCTRNCDAPATLHGDFEGTAQAFQASLSSTPLLVAAAILVVYVVLGMLYESFIHPITILSALPSAGVGALLMLMLFGWT